MARRRYNPRQPRDKNGRWTSGGGSAGRVVSKSSGRKGAARRKKVAVGALATATLAFGGRKAIQHGAIAVVHAKSGRPILAGAHATAAATGAYRAVSTSTGIIVQNSSKLSKRQKATFQRRKAVVDKHVAKVEKVQNLILAGGYLLQVAGPIAASRIRANRSAARIGPAEIGAGLKVTKSRSGVYNISGFKGKRVG